MNGTQIKHPIECKCFSWSPVVAGALIALGLAFLLNLFSIAIGLTSYNIDTTGTESLVFGGLCATALGLVASMFASGFMAGYLGNRHCYRGHLGALYGFLTWCLALIVTIFMAESAAHYITFYSHFISGVSDTATMTAHTAHTAHNGAGMQAVAVSLQTTKVALSAYIVFVLFFLGAFACSFGGHCGMRYAVKHT